MSFNAGPIIPLPLNDSTYASYLIESSCDIAPVRYLIYLFLSCKRAKIFPSSSSIILEIIKGTKKRGTKVHKKPFEACPKKKGIKGFITNQYLKNISKRRKK